MDLLLITENLTAEKAETLKALWRSVNREPVNVSLYVTATDPARIGQSDDLAINDLLRKAIRHAGI